MYAFRRTIVKNWEHESPEERYTVRVRRGGEPVKGLNEKNIAYVEEEVMTWRKANQIHYWFVKNQQSGNDNCGTYHVSFDDLELLRDDCDKVLVNSKLVDGTVYAGTVYDHEHPDGVEQREPGKVIEDPTVAKAVLPTMPGFFFGSTEYDEYYLQDVKDTRDWCNRMLKDHEAGVPGVIFYSSSW